MKIDFYQTGGFGGMSRSRTLDTDQLPPEEREQIDSLFAQSGIDRSMELRSPKARDATLYRIAIRKDDKEYDVLVDDLSIPAQLRPLVRCLQGYVKPQSGK